MSETEILKKVVEHFYDEALEAMDSDPDFKLAPETENTRVARLSWFGINMLAFGFRKGLEIAEKPEMLSELISTAIKSIT